jgi:hypothetical protein
MSRIIQARNVNRAFMDGWHWMRVDGVQEASRNGPVLVANGMVITEYSQPTERVLFNPDRDANPVFHLMEAIWMLAGCREVEWLRQFNANIATYAEPEGYIHGAYGYRWRHGFGVDQLPVLIEILRKTPDSRQSVLQMWNASKDLTYYPYKDRPCNTHAYFDLRGGVLNMTVCCRSNDMLWGAYGANAVHFSILQEVIAHAVRAPVGVYRQVSNNFHVYTNNDIVKNFLANPPMYDWDAYSDGTTAALALLQEDETWIDLLAECEKMVRHGRKPVYNSFLRDVAHPLMEAYLLRQQKKEWSVAAVPDCDWKLAFTEWVERRDLKEKT